MTTSQRRVPPPAVNRGNATRASPFLAGKDLPVLYQTRHYIVIDKPAGLAAHPGSGGGDSVETRLVRHPRGGPWLAHRLDRDTTGCLLIARRKTALIAAQKAFLERRTRKIYWAIVHGYPQEREGIIDLALIKDTTPQGWRMRPAPEGAPSKTRWRMMGYGNGLSVLELDLCTGRTHQARAHCAALGTPILNDPVYGTPEGCTEAGSLCLLARQLIVSCPDETIRGIARPSVGFQSILNRIPSFSQS